MKLLKASSDIGVNLITKLVNVIVRETSVPDDWLKSVIINIYKGKVVERVVDKLIRQSVNIHEI